MWFLCFVAALVLFLWLDLPFPDLVEAEKAVREEEK
jgi:hypothetical protein